MAIFSFDPSKQSTVYFRCNRNGSKKFIFKNTDGTPYSLTGTSFAAWIKQNPQSATHLIDLTCTVGGTASNELTITITAAQSNIKAKDYYFELVESVSGKTYINAIATFNNGVFDGVDDDDETITIDLAGADVNITITAGGGSGSSIYTGNSPTTVTVGGLIAGTSILGLTITQILQLMLAPYIVPTFSSFNISGQSQSVEVGTTLSGVKTFLWNIIVNSGVVSSLDIIDVTASSTLLANTPNDGTQAVTINTKQLNSSGANQQFQAKGHDTGSSPSDFLSGIFQITAYFLEFWGPVSATVTNSTTIRALGSNAFRTGGNTFILNTGSTLVRFDVALPPGSTITQVIDLDALNADITSSYVSKGTISVTDAGGTSRSYNVYEMLIGVAYSSSHRHQISVS